MINCQLDEFVPLEGAYATEPSISYAEIRKRAVAACKTAHLLEDDDSNAGNVDFGKVAKNVKEVLNNVAQGQAVSSAKVDEITSTATGAYYLNNILRNYETEVVSDAKRLRTFVTNKLIMETENPDGRIRIKALELLGKISDVGLFTERTEVTINNRANNELADMLRDKLRKLMVPSDTADAVIIAPPVAKTISTNVAASLKGA